MRGWFRSGVVALLLSLLASLPAAAEPMPMSTPMAMPTPTCTAPVAPTGELAPWSAPVPLKAGSDADALASAWLAVGQAARLTLLPTPDVRYPLRPEKPGGSVSYGGLVGLAVDRAGTYRVALGSGAWIDLVADGKAVTSVAHGHGPDCTGIRKMVDFALQPGRYFLQLSANGDAQTSLLVVRLP